jgi:hypothetical protein
MAWPPFAREYIASSGRLQHKPNLRKSIELDNFESRDFYERNIYFLLNAALSSAQLSPRVE